MSNKTKVFLIIAFCASFVCFSFVFRSEKIVFNIAEAQNQSDRLSLEISQSEGSYLQDEPILINLKLFNQTEQAISWQGRLGGISHTTFITTDAAGVQSRFDGNKHMAGGYVLMSKVMKPGEKLEKLLLLSDDLLEKILPNPGQYNLQLEFVYDGDAEGNQRTKILSNSISLNIAEPYGINKQAHKFIKEKIRSYKLKTREDTRIFAQRKQEFVDKFRNSVYAKYIIFSLANTYQTIGEDAKAVRELCKIHDENFYYSENIERMVFEIDERLNPIVQAAGLPIPVLKHPCTGKVIN